jgi:CRP/FNR family cyclic AMP-dependent transcriptional regulator
VSIATELRSLPLFQGIPEARLEQLVAIFRPVSKKAGTVLFAPNELATHFEVLVKGEVSLEEEGAVKLSLRPFAPLGELGALTGIPRSTRAVAATDVELLAVPVADLHGFFDENADIGLVFTKNLLAMVSEKVRRDRRLLASMKHNIIRTQKAMKQMRDTVLESTETEMSKPLFETLENLIHNNRRANYRVSPTAAAPAQVRLDDGRTRRVMEVSEGYLKVEGTATELTSDPTYWAGVLMLPVGEVLVSGSVLREGEGGVVVKLDGMVDEFKGKLDAYMTQLQLLDYVV